MRLLAAVLSLAMVAGTSPVILADDDDVQRFIKQMHAERDRRISALNAAISATRKEYDRQLNSLESQINPTKRSLPMPVLSPWGLSEGQIGVIDLLAEQPCGDTKANNSLRLVEVPEPNEVIVVPEMHFILPEFPHPVPVYHLPPVPRRPDSKRFTIPSGTPFLIRGIPKPELNPVTTNSRPPNHFPQVVEAIPDDQVDPSVAPVEVVTYFGGTVFEVTGKTDDGKMFVLEPFDMSKVIPAVKKLAADSQVVDLEEAASNELERCRKRFHCALTEIAEKYPDTTAAVKARELLGTQ